MLPIIYNFCVDTQLTHNTVSVQVSGWYPATILFCVNIELCHTHATVYNICAFPATLWDPTITVPFAISFSTQLPETQPLFTISVLIPTYYLKPNHSLQFPCLYPATVWKPATIYNFWSVPNYLRLKHCLFVQFLCRYQTETQPLFTASVLVPNYYLSPKHYLQFLWWHTTET